MISFIFLWLVIWIAIGAALFHFGYYAIPRFFNYSRVAAVGLAFVYVTLGVIPPIIICL